MSRRGYPAKVAWLVAGLVCVALAGTASSSGTLRGRVVDPSGGPRAQVTVRVADDTGLELETHTDVRGRFVVRGLPAGSYTVSAYGDGFEWVETVDVRVAPSTDTVLVVPVAEVDGDVFVRRTGSPVIRTGATDGGYVMEPSDRLPLPGRQPLGDLLSWLPGAVPAVDDPWRAREPSPTGSSAGRPRLEIDGHEATGVAGGWRGAAAPQGSLEAVRVVTAGAGVARSAAPNGTVMLAMRRGTPETAGDVRLWAGGASWAGAGTGRPAERELAVEPHRTVAATATVGGATAAHGLSWRVTADGLRASDTLTTITVAASDGRRVPVERERRRDRVRGAARLAWRPVDGLRVDLTFLEDHEQRDRETAATLTFDPVGGAATDVGFDVSGRRRLIGLSGSLVTRRGDLLEGRIGRYRERLDFTPRDPRPSVRDQTVEGHLSGGVGAGAVGGGAGFAIHRDDARTVTARVAGTWGVRDHEIDAGVAFDETAVRRSWADRAAVTQCVALAPGAIRFDPATGGGAPIVPDCRVGGAEGVGLPFGSGERLRVADAAAVLLMSGADGPGLDGTRRETSAWLADRWTPSSNVTVEGGVRISDLELRVEHPAPAAVDLGIDDRLQWGLGVAWDPEGSGRTRVWAHVGRIRPTLPTRLDGGALFGDFAPRVRLEPGFGDGGPLGRVVEIREVAPVTVSPDVVSPAFDELALGGEWELLGDVAVGTEMRARRWTRELVRVWLPDARLQMLAPTGSVIERHPFTGEALAAPVPVPDAYREEQSATVYGVKRYRAGWQLGTALTWSRVTGHPAPGRAVDARRWDGPVVTEPFVVEALSDSTVASLTERRWQLRMQGSYAWDPGPVVGVSAWWMRGSVVPRTVGVARDLELDQQTVAGTARLADPWTVDVRVEWPVPLAHGDLGLIVEVRNLFDRQTPLAGDPRWAVSDRPDPDTGRAEWGEPLMRQAPRTVWAGARWSWR